MTLNHSWHRVFGSCRFIGNCWTAHVASDRALLQKELVVAQVWSSSYVRKTKSREERGSSMLGRLTPMIVPPKGVSQPASGPPHTHSGAHPWHQHGHGAAGSSGAMEDADSTEVVYKIRQWSLPGATVVPVLNVSSRVFWLELDDKALLDSYTVLQEGILCDVFSQKCSAAWQGARGERLTVPLPSCCRAVKMRMTGSISCCRKRTYGPPLQPGVLSQRRSPNRSFVRSGAGCRPSICGWRSSCGGVCLPTECTPRPPLQSPKKNSMLCFLTGLPGAATRIRMKKKLIVDLQSKKPKHGGGNAKSGCHASKVKVSRWSSTSRAFWRLCLVRKQKLILKWMHLWSIVRKGGRLERALINSSDVVWSQTLGTRLRTKVQT